MGKAYLICMREPNPEALEAIRTLWPDDDHIQLSDTSVLVAHSNGGESVYDLIESKLPDSEPLQALIVRVGKAHHGYEVAPLWEWLAERA